MQGMDTLTIVDINNLLSIINRASITGEEADTITALKTKLQSMKAGAVNNAVDIQVTKKEPKAKN